LLRLSDQVVDFYKKKDVLKKHYTESGKNFQAVFQFDVVVKKKCAVIIVNPVRRLSYGAFIL